jgi:hypothetical protein
MLTLPEIRDRLRMVGPVAVARAVSVRVQTIIDIRDGRTINPSYATLKALSDYFEGVGV